MSLRRNTFRAERERDAKKLDTLASLRPHALKMFSFDPNLVKKRDCSIFENFNKEKQSLTPVVVPQRPQDYNLNYF